ncbi:McrC family protein [Janibacter melonis]|uniref:McrC family protein n=1 Tax=Janibacter melonis TaxID=262209 RepID=UPI0020944632|nr:McrC family protein [Janibacter melonis]
MIAHLVREYLESVEVLLSQGLMRNYVRRQSVTSSPKGRLLVAATMTRLSVRGIDFQVECERFERTDENPANQALKEALVWARTWSEAQQDPRAPPLRSAAGSV